MSLLKIIYGLMSGGQTAIPKIDRSTQSWQMVDYEHHEVHSGRSFTAYIHNDNLAKDDLMEILLVTPNTTKWAHMMFQVESAKEVSVLFSEAPTVTANGSTVSTHCRNRNSSSVATVLIYKDPTISNDGTVLYESGGKDSEISQRRSLAEWILKQNTEYLIRVKSFKNDNATTLRCVWYEHADIN